MVADEDQKIRRYADAEHSVWNGDALLYRKSVRLLDPFSLIAAVVRGIHPHVGTAVWCRGKLMVGHQRAIKGCHLVPLEKEVQRYRIDVYRPRVPHWKREAVVDDLLDRVGKRYNFVGVIIAWLSFWFGLRWFMRHDLSDGPQEPQSREHCSQMVSNLWRQVHEDPVPHRPDYATLPGELMHSRLFEYQFTLEA